MHKEYFMARLSEKDKDNLANFDCYNPNEFSSLHPRKQKAIKRLSLDMNHFLQSEAISEQEEGYNTTFLLKNSQNKIFGYISLCADGIKLNYEERDSGSIGYEIFPALKIARLAIHKDHQRNGIGKLLIDYAVAKALRMRNLVGGVRFLTLDCYPHRLSYYQKRGFVENLEHRNEDRSKPISLRLDIDKYLDHLLNDLYE